jgi:hypothetical protein
VERACDHSTIYKRSRYLNSIDVPDTIADFLIEFYPDDILDLSCNVLMASPGCTVVAGGTEQL